MNTTMTVQELIDAKEKLEKELLKVGCTRYIRKILYSYRITSYINTNSTFRLLLYVWW